MGTTSQQDISEKGWTGLIASASYTVILQRTEGLDWERQDKVSTFRVSINSQVKTEKTKSMRMWIFTQPHYSINLRGKMA